MAFAHRWVSFRLFALAVATGGVFVSTVASCRFREGAALASPQSPAAPVNPVASAMPGKALVALDSPFLFAYGTWQDKARIDIEKGVVVLRGAGITPRGGAGCNAALNLSGAGADSPALSLRVGAANRAPGLRLLLRDASGQTATFNFTLPKPGGWQVVTPENGASFARPNSLDKADRALDLKQVMQWQLSGDWSGDNALDVEVNGLLRVAPNADLMALRAAQDRDDAAQKAKIHDEQEALRAKYGKRGATSPVVTETYLVAPDVLALAIQAGRVVPGALTKYAPQSGDARHEHDRQVILARGGQEIGWLIGPQRDNLVTFERLEGDPLLEFLAASPDTYAVRSPDDAAFARPVKPLQVYRKSKPTDWTQPGHAFAMRHIVYLKLPHSLTPGKTYVVSVGDLNTRQPETTFAFRPARARSEAVHVNQIGFRPDDPAKRAFLSVWLGTGGVQTYPDTLAFHLVDEATGAVAYTGRAVRAKAASEPETMQRVENFNKTDVCRMDFGAFRKPGRYCVVVAGIGSSYPFEIGPNVWERAFQTQMRGLYNERSGVALGPPYTAFRKPRDFHPADGVKVVQSTYSVLDGGGEFDVAKHGTDTPVPNAWGGYHDAGDWNPRRATHLRVTMAHLELLALFPAYFRALPLNIPKIADVPDTLTEALFEIDFFRRLQTRDGAVGYGVETDGDPIDGEVSWLQSLPAFVYKPDLWSSYIYAGAALRAAKLLAPTRPDLAKTYRASGLRAMQWAEGEYAKRKADDTLKTLRWEAKDDRNLAAVLGYDLTGDAHWRDIFLENTCLTDPDAKLFVWGDHVQRDAAFAYACLPDKLTDSTLKRSAIRATEAQAQTSLTYASGNAFNITTADPGKPMFLGFYSAPDAVELVRAHYLTHKPEYLAGAVQACQFSAGCNPINMTYTVGLGANWPQHPLHLDSRRTGQPAPTGLTVYGNFDFVGWKNQDWATWPIKYYLDSACTPSAWDWPIPEAYFDIFLYPATDEFTIDAWTPNVYVWGYLAARK